jgi:hypothetical protein
MTITVHLFIIIIIAVLQQRPQKPITQTQGKTRKRHTGKQRTKTSGKNNKKNTL